MEGLFLPDKDYHMDWIKTTVRDSLILVLSLAVGYGILRLADSTISPGEMGFITAIAIAFLALRNVLRHRGSRHADQ